MLMWKISEVVFEDWTTDRHQAGTVVRIVNAEEYDISPVYERGYLIIKAHRSDQREKIPLSRVYSILENRVED
jgi:hypothetical protein